METIAVTGASGGLGSRVIRSLFDLGTDASVVVLTRTPEAIPERPHLSARYASYEDASSLRRSLGGVDTLVFISSDGTAEPMRRHHGNVVSAAIEAGVGHVVYLSIVDVAPESPFYYASVHRETEALLAESGLSYAFARSSIYADYFVSEWLTPASAQGTLALPAGAGRMSLVTRDDVGRGLAALAIRRTPMTAAFTGPAALTGTEICEIASIAAGRQIRYVALEDLSYRAGMARAGEPDWLIEAYSTMFASVRDGRFGTVSADLPDLVGAPQQSFEEFLVATQFGKVVGGT